MPVRYTPGARLQYGRAHFVVTDRTAVPVAVGPFVKAVAEELRASTAELTPRVTGTLQRGWRVRKVGQDRYEVYNLVFYGRWVEFGSRHNQPPVAMFGRALAQARARYGIA